MNKESLASRLKEARKKSGLSIAQVAARLKITEGGVRHNENGTRKPSLGQLIKYALLYKTPLDILLLGREIAPQGSHEPDELSLLWPKLSPRDQKRMLTMLRDMADEEDVA